MFCHRCGTHMPDNSAFCRMCGSALLHEGVPAAQPAAVAASVSAAGGTPAPDPLLSTTVLWPESARSDLPPMPPRRQGEWRRRKRHRRWYQKMGSAVKGYVLDGLKVAGLFVTAGVVLYLSRH